MLEAKYYRNYGHNYMILQCKQQESVRSYQYKILTSGKINDILSCSLRHINGTTYYYYNISSRTTLESLYRNKKMSSQEVRDVLCQIHGICKKLAGYFMEESGLVLLPEHIYYDITNGRYIGLYYPDYKSNEINAYKSLIDFLLEHIDTEDRKLAENMYRICEMAEGNYFFIEDAIKILENEEEPIQETSERLLYDENREPVITKMDSFDIKEDWTDSCRSGNASAKKNLFYPVFAVLSALSIAGAALVCSIYELTQREEIVLYGSMAVMAVCLVLCLAGFYSGRRKETEVGESYGSKADREPQQDIYEETYRDLSGQTDMNYPVDKTLPPIENVISRNMNLEIARNGSAFVGRGDDEDGRLQLESPNTVRKTENYGNTVFLDESATKEFKLYAMDQKNKIHIELKQFPCMVGKMAGCVDYVLSDDSVSRIHARFDIQGEKVLLTDMNSTNGTYKNGLRMQPQETVVIEPGDEVRFGNLNYCYR